MPILVRGLPVTEILLEVRQLSASYGAIQALSGVSLQVPHGGIVALLGSNGAGKSTTLNAISRLIPSCGEVLFDGQPIHRLHPDQIVRQGLVQVPEGRQAFRDMSVQENLELGAFVRGDGHAAIAATFEEVYALFPRLKERCEQRASTLSGGELQMLAIGRALMSEPRMIMFDEPSMGLSPLLVKQIFEAIKKLNRERGLTILLVEQDVQLTLTVADYAYILENGEITLQGHASELINDPAVRHAYLGT